MESAFHGDAADQLAAGGARGFYFNVQASPAEHCTLTRPQQLPLLK
jgi:hypothetical protein